MTSTLAGLLDVFDVDASGPSRFVGESDAGTRDVIDASQLLAQSIVACSKTLPAKTVRRASGTFCRPVRAHEPIDFAVEVVQEGRTFATVVVTASQQGKACASVTVLMDVPSADVIRHADRVVSGSLETAIPLDMPVIGREIRLVDVVDPNDPDEVGPAEIDAWLRYEPAPDRDDLKRALLAHFTGHLSISATMRGHAGIGTAMAHHTVSTAVMAISVHFHDPIDWQEWILYRHESTSVGAGMSYVRGEILTQSGRLIASFSQDGMIRAFDHGGAATQIEARARL